MRVLSASEAVAPAIKRTKEILFQPFSWKRSWKMAGVGTVSGFAIVYVPNIPMLNHSRMPAGVPHAFLLTMNLFTIFMAIGMSALLLGLFYLGARMQLVFFETTVTRQTTIAHLWRKYGRRTWRWFGIKILPSILFFVPFTAFTLSLSRAIAQQQARMQEQIQQGTMNPAAPLHMMAAAFSMMIGIFLLTAVIMLLSGIIGDFAMPSIALEDASFTLAWKRLGEIIRNDPPGVAFYIFLKLILGIVMVIGAYITAIIAVAVPGLLIALCGFLLNRGLTHAGIAGTIIMFLLATLAILAMVVYFFYLYVLISGAVFTFFEAYAIYFVAGRYQPLGDALEPPMIEPPPAAAAPAPLPEPSL